MAYERRQIAYAAEEFQTFSSCQSAKPTCWHYAGTFLEKAPYCTPNTIGRRVADATIPVSAYYDLATMAAEKMASREQDITFSYRWLIINRVLRSAWAHYETARPGTLRLSPILIDCELRSDYREMAPMIFDYPALGLTTS